MSQFDQDSVSAPETSERAAEREQNVSMEISNTMVRLYKEQFRRGPTKARTHWCGPDLITVTLENTLTPAERNLVKMGEHQRLRDLRMFVQYGPAARRPRASRSSGPRACRRTRAAQSHAQGFGTAICNCGGGSARHLVQHDGVRTIAR